MKTIDDDSKVRNKSFGEICSYELIFKYIRTWGKGETNYSTHRKLPKICRLKKKHNTYDIIYGNIDTPQTYPYHIIIIPYDTC